MEELKIEMLPVTALKMDNRNSRKHADLDINAIAKSIEKYGFNDPIGIWGKDNLIIEGHGRLLACKQLGIEKVPCIRLDHLTDEERREYAILHNKTAELSMWDFDILRQEIEELKFDGIPEIDWELPENGIELGIEHEEKGEVPFTEILHEEHNYVVLFFDNDVDWLQAKSVFDIKTVKELSTKKDGNGKPKYGVGHILKGKEVIDRILKNENIG